MRKRRKARIGGGGAAARYSGYSSVVRSVNCLYACCRIAFKCTQNELTVTRLGAPNEKVYRAFIA